MPLPLVRYRVIIRSPEGEKVAEFDNWRKLNYEKRVNDIGNYTFTINGIDSRSSLFELDGQIEIQRTDLANSIDWYIDYEGLHRAPIRKTLDNGDEEFSSIGVGYNDLLARRVIGYKAGTIRAAKSGVAEYVMKSYVSENCGAEATVANGRLIIGVIPGFYVQDNSGNGVSWSGDRSFEVLLDVLQEIAEYSNIDFAVVGAGEAKWRFETYKDQMGSDRTTLGLDGSTGLNGAGNPPTIFSIGSGNVRDLAYSDDHLREANVVFVLGRGDGSTRTVIVREKDTAIEKSPMNQREVARPASKNEFEYQLIAFGDEVLEDMKSVEAVTFSHIQQESAIYGRDFFLGDKITLNYDGVDYHKRIVGIKISVERGDNEKLSMEFADLP